jgi:hypothetical protein
VDVKRVARLGIVLVVAALAAQTGVARADTAPIVDSPDLPWTNPDHQSSLEVLASSIASVIAKRPVTVRCEGDTDWFNLVLQSRGNPASELGYVGVSVGGADGLTVTVSTVTELAGGKVCLPLKRFAVATTKPTKCRSLIARESAVYVSRRVAVKTTVVVVGGKRYLKTTWVTRRVPAKTIKTVLGPPTSCFHPTRVVEEVPSSFWDNYQVYATAILALAHEAIHLGGIVLARAANGGLVGDGLAEAKAECYGLQWMPYVAKQLGDTPDDAQAIARYFWTEIYPGYQASQFNQYWSADCRPGGALDLHLPGPPPWPSI